MEPLITITGNLGNNPEKKVSRKGNEYLLFRVASNQRVQRDGQWVDDGVTWMNVRCYGQLAVNAFFSLALGDPVIVTGKLRTDTWKNEDGTEATKLFLEAAAIGHDLSFGTSASSRTSRRRDTPAMAIDPENGERVDMVTGELVNEAATAEEPDWVAAE